MLGSRHAERFLAFEMMEERALCHFGDLAKLVDRGRGKTPHADRVATGIKEARSGRTDAQGCVLSVRHKKHNTIRSVLFKPVGIAGAVNLGLAECGNIPRIYLIRSKGNGGSPALLSFRVDSLQGSRMAVFHAAARSRQCHSGPARRIMDDIVGLAILAAIFFLLVVPAIAIVALVQVGGWRNRLDRLEGRLSQGALARADIPRRSKDHYRPNRRLRPRRHRRPSRSGFPNPKRRRAGCSAPRNVPWRRP